MDWRVALSKPWRWEWRKPFKEIRTGMSKEWRGMEERNGGMERHVRLRSQKKSENQRRKKKDQTLVWKVRIEDESAAHKLRTNGAQTAHKRRSSSLYSESPGGREHAQCAAHCAKIQLLACKLFDNLCRTIFFASHPTMSKKFPRI